MSPKPASETLYDFEIEHRLFSYGKIPIWDIVRCQVFNNILFTDDPPPLRQNRSILKKIKLLFIVFFSQKNLLFSKKIFFFYGASRFLDKETNTYYDPYYQGFKSIYNESDICFVESNLKYESNKIVNNSYSLDGIFRKIATRFTWVVNKEEKEFVKRTVCLVKRDYPNYNLDNRELYTLITKFKIEVFYYSLVFRISRFKYLLLVQNGIQKALIYAALKYKIKVYEFQHGDISRYSAVYLYKKKIEKSIQPTAYLLFSDIWKHKMIQIPSFKIGSYLHSSNKGNVKCKKNSDDFLIISSLGHELELNELILKISKELIHTTFFYKLHPAQYPRKEYFEKLFSKHENVIVCDDRPAIEYLHEFENIIAIYSTALFEAYDAGCNIFIYKRSNYYLLNDFHLERFIYFDDEWEFIKLVTTKKVRTKKSEAIFFAPFDTKSLTELISIL